MWKVLGNSDTQLEKVPSLPAKSESSRLADRLADRSTLERIREASSMNATQDESNTARVLCGMYEVLDVVKFGGE
jgi:hypothetical protein